MPDINMLDVAVAVTLLAYLIRGLMRGFTGEVAGLVGIVLAFVVARHFQSDIEPLVGKFFSDRRMTSGAAYALVFCGVLVLNTIVFALIRKFLNMTFASWIDTVAGGVTGTVKGLLLWTVLFFFALEFLSGTELVKTAKVAPFFKSMAGHLRDYLPSVFPYNLIRLPI